jgi:hypothetical protein
MIGKYYRFCYFFIYIQIFLLSSELKKIKINKILIKKINKN